MKALFFSICHQYRNKRQCFFDEFFCILTKQNLCPYSIDFAYLRRTEIDKLVYRG
ncbi:MAG: hypothetical protein IJP75_00680 [Bacteroidaceae bacterium]|nr:hypothetical protein [Bacteroidaceae bacterium]